MLAYASRLNVPEPVCNQYQKEQRNRESNAQGQCLDGTVTLALVCHQEEQRGSQTAENQGKSNGDDYFHDDLEPAAAEDDPPDAVCE